jgi:hypothetical protein
MLQQYVKTERKLSKKWHRERVETELKSLNKYDPLPKGIQLLLLFQYVIEDYAFSQTQVMYAICLSKI